MAKLQVGSALVLALALQVLYVDASMNSKLSALRKNLMGDYDKLVKPDEKTVVGFKLELVNFGLCPVTNKFHVSGWHQMKWTDSRLKWDPKDWNGIKSIQIPASEIWVPDVMPYNVVDTITQNYFDWLTTTNVVLTHTGDVIYVPPINVKTFCQASSKPEGPHTCSMKIGSWTYHKEQLDLEVWGDDSPWGTEFLQNNEVQITGQTHNYEAKKYDCCEELYPSIDMSLTFTQPKPKYPFGTKA